MANSCIDFISKYENSLFSMANFGGADATKPNVDPELQDFLMAENERARLSAQIHEFTDICWDKCVEKPSNKLDSRTESCLANCVNRFVDTSLLITQRFAQSLQKSQGIKYIHHEMPSKGPVQLPLAVSCGSLLVFALLTLLSVPGTAGSLQYMDVSSQRKAHYCGAKLSDTLATLCNRFNGFRKKSERMLMPFLEQRLLDGVQRDVEELRELHDRSADMIQQALTTLQHLNTHGQDLRRRPSQRASMSSSNGVGSSTLYVLQTLVLLWSVTVVTANKRYCGAELVKVLSFLCDEFPDLHTANKKAMDTFKMDMSSGEWMNADDSSPQTQQQQQQQQMILDQQLQSVGMTDDRASVPAWMNMVYPANYMFRHGAGHNELIPARFRKSRGGIVEECCLRPCGMAQLLQSGLPASTPGLEMLSARCVFVSVACLLLLAGSLQTVGAKRYCGDQLPRVLAMLCIEYFSLDDLKKNTVGYFGPLSASPFTAELDWSGGENFNEMAVKRGFNRAAGPHDDDWIAPWFKKKPSHRFIVPHMRARFRRDVANECCREDCSMDQLLSYCKVVAPGVLSV
uniref:Insulin-like domain-containing protein n=1 Tax=Anopheles dirus TaxID=7168 RepID=A0A182MYG5_9DIPT